MRSTNSKPAKIIGRQTSGRFSRFQIAHAHR